MARYNVSATTEIRTVIASVEADCEAEAIEKTKILMPTELSQQFEVLITLGNQLSILSTPIKLSAKETP